MVRLSIIIPVYNVERYIGKCLESCYAQDIDTTEYEIIIVDDSSPDNSINIVREYQSIYDNIKIIYKLHIVFSMLYFIHTEKGGVSV